MARDPRLGVMINFAIEKDEDQRFRSWIWIDVKKGQTVARIAADRGHPEDAQIIAKENGIRNVNSKFSGHKKGKKRIKVPGELRASLQFNVFPGDSPPRITGGYAKISTIDRPERVGLSTFDGYDPITMEVPIRFEATTRSPTGEKEGADIEDAIEKLERMAGRGQFEGAATGSNPIIRVTVPGKDPQHPTPLIPTAYQWTPDNPKAPLWRVADIDWDQNPIRNRAGNRIRQLATVTLIQYTRINLLSRSATGRAAAAKKGKKDWMSKKLPGSTVVRPGGFGR